MKYDKDKNILILCDEKYVTLGPEVRDVFIDEGCSQVNISGTSRYIYIGKRNVGLNINSSSYVTIGDDNKSVTLQTANFNTIKNECRNITLNSGRGNFIDQSRSVSLDLSSSNNVVEGSRDVHISSDFNKVEQSLGVTLHKDTACNDVKGSSEIDVSNSLSIKAIKAQNSSITLTNNSTIKASDLTITEQRPFREYKNGESGNVLCKLYGDLTEYNVDRENGTILMKDTNNLVDCPHSDDGSVYARCNGQWLRIGSIGDIKSPTFIKQ